MNAEKKAEIEKAKKAKAKKLKEGKIVRK